MTERLNAHEPIPVRRCPICGDAMAAYHCKWTCRNCGYQEDCSDLFEAGPTDVPQPPAQRRSAPHGKSADNQ